MKGQRINTTAIRSASVAPPKTPVRMLMSVMPTWTVESMAPGDSTSASALPARSLPSSTAC